MNKFKMWSVWREMQSTNLLLNSLIELRVCIEIDELNMRIYINGKQLENQLKMIIELK